MSARTAEFLRYLLGALNRYLSISYAFEMTKKRRQGIENESKCASPITRF